jgi:microcystin-dependent protein
MPDHTHTVSDPGHDHPQWTYGGGSGPVGAGTSPSGAKNTSAIDTQTATTGITISNTGGSTSFDNRPAYLELCFIIKT